jgi:hypothetical protein
LVLKKEKYAGRFDGGRIFVRRFVFLNLRAGEAFYFLFKNISRKFCAKGLKLHKLFAIIVGKIAWRSRNKR